jgi:predicted ribonuclease YlaK
VSFEIKKAKLERVPLLVSLIGMSGSGKTYSALELAKGMSRVYKGRTVLKKVASLSTT